MCMTRAVSSRVQCTKARRIEAFCWSYTQPGGRYSFGVSPLLAPNSNTKREGMSLQNMQRHLTNLGPCLYDREYHQAFLRQKPFHLLSVELCGGELLEQNAQQLSKPCMVPNASNQLQMTKHTEKLIKKKINHRPGDPLTKMLKLNPWGDLQKLEHLKVQSLAKAR